MVDVTVDDSVESWALFAATSTVVATSPTFIAMVRLTVCSTATLMPEVTDF